MADVDLPAPVPWAVVVNPTKFDVAEIEAGFAAICAGHGWAPPRWYQTTVEDPGTGQAKQAVADGAELVCPLGGDGTVRAVAAGLVHTETAIGLLPGGTGNLLARNLRLPIGDLDAALTVALTGRDVRIDAAEVSFDDDDPQIFLVMAGMGLDAEAMATADDALKRHIGWLAYLISGMGRLFRLGFAVRVEAADARAVSLHARTVIVGNCGELTGGLALMPEASLTDGELNTVLASPNSLSAWLAIMVNVLTRRRRGHAAMVSLASRQVDVYTKEPIVAQLDGDAVGPKLRMSCRVLPGALKVRLR